MIIRKTARVFVRRAPSLERQDLGALESASHCEKVLRETWRLFFVPIYTRDTIKRTSLRGNY